MTFAPLGFRPLPVPALVRRVQAAAPTQEPTPKPSVADFETYLLRGIEMAARGSDGYNIATAAFWNALKVGTTLDHTMRVVDAVTALGPEYHDLKVAAMNQAIVRIGSRTDAFDVARALHSKRGDTYQWVKGALNKAIELCTTPEACMEIADWCRENGRWRYSAQRREAVAKAEKLATRIVSR